MNPFTQKLITLALTLYTLSGVNAQDKRVEVLLLGTFHFDNPGLDVAKFESVNILSPKRQQEVKAVVDQLIAYKPDKIFIEVEPAQQARWDSLFRQYQAGKFTPKANEIYQLGFPVAKALNHSRLYAADYRDADFPADSLMKVLASSNQQGMLQTVQTKIQQIEQEFNANLPKYTLAQLLKIANTPAERTNDVMFYVYLIGAGRLDNHVGAYLASEWWRRNMVIYANMLKQMTGTEKRIVVLFGASHTALLRNLMQYNPTFRLAEVSDVLK